MTNNLFDTLHTVTQKPAPYSIYNSPEFWNDPYISKRLLHIHLNPETDMFSRSKETVAKEMQWINDRFKIGAGMKVCDFGCGPGLYTSEWAKAGADVTGIDVSELSIAHAKEHAEKEGVKVNYLCQDYLQYTTSEKFNLITMIYCIFCELNPEQRKALLKKFHDLLEDDGSILLDVYSMNVFAEKEEKESSFASSAYPCAMSNFWSPDYHYLFTSYFKYDDENLSLDKYSVITPEGIRDVYIWLQYFNLETLKAEFEASGFKIVEHYADLMGNKTLDGSQTVAVVAQKA